MPSIRCCISALQSPCSPASASSGRRTTTQTPSGIRSRRNSAARASTSAAGARSGAFKTYSKRVIVNLDGNFNQGNTYQQGRLDLVDSYQGLISRTLPMLVINCLSDG